MGGALTLIAAQHANVAAAAPFYGTPQVPILRPLHLRLCYCFLCYCWPQFRLSGGNPTA
jgi:hypothetical protein